MTYTPNLELTKVDLSDMFDINHFNDNMSILDTEIGGLKNKVNNLGAKVVIDLKEISGVIDELDIAGDINAGTKDKDGYYLHLQGGDKDFSEKIPGIYLMNTSLEDDEQTNIGDELVGGCLQFLEPYYLNTNCDLNIIAPRHLLSKISYDKNGSGIVKSLVKITTDNDSTEEVGFCPGLGIEDNINGFAWTFGVSNEGTCRIVKTTNSVGNKNSYSEKCHIDFSDSGISLIKGSKTYNFLIDKDKIIKKEHLSEDLFGSDDEKSLYLYLKKLFAQKLKNNTELNQFEDFLSNTPEINKKITFSGSSSKQYIRFNNSSKEGQYVKISSDGIVIDAGPKDTAQTSNNKKSFFKIIGQNQTLKMDGNEILASKKTKNGKISIGNLYLNITQKNGKNVSGIGISNKIFRCYGQSVFKKTSTFLKEIYIKVSKDSISKKSGKVSGGVLTIGLKNKHHMSFDSNEIQTSIGTAPSTLYLNKEGGDVVVGGALTVKGKLNISSLNTANLKSFTISNNSSASSEISAKNKDKWVAKISTTSKSAGVTAKTTGKAKRLIYLDNSGNVKSNITSDKRLKDYVGPLTNEEASSLLNEVKPINFKYKNSDIVNSGFYAQDFKNCLLNHEYGYRPYLIIEENATEDDSCDINLPEEDVTYGLDYAKLTPILWAGWQMHEERIKQLEQKIIELESKLK